MTQYLLTVSIARVTGLAARRGAGYQGVGGRRGQALATVAAASGCVRPHRRDKKGGARPGQRGRLHTTALTTPNLSKMKGSSSKTLSKMVVPPSGTWKIKRVFMFLIVHRKAICTEDQFVGPRTGNAILAEDVGAKSPGNSVVTARVTAFLMPRGGFNCWCCYYANQIAVWLGK